MNFALSSEEISDIEKKTRGQRKNENWFSYRIGRISASNVGDVVKSRSFTSNITVLKKICKPSLNLTSPALRYGCKHEKDGLAFYEAVFKNHKNFKVKK